MPSRSDVYAALREQVIEHVKRNTLDTFPNKYLWQPEERKKTLADWLLKLEMDDNHLQMTAVNCLRCLLDNGVVWRGEYLLDQRPGLDDIFVAIDREREYQDLQWPQDAPDDAAELLLIKVYLRRAQDAWANEPGDLAALHEIRKLAAIAVRALERVGVDISKELVDELIAAQVG